MHRAWIWLGVGIAYTLSVAAESQPVPHRSPIDVTAIPGTWRALAANHTADSATLVDLTAGKVLAEIACGRRPAGVACSRDGRRAAVSNLWSGTLTLLEITGSSLRVAGTADVGAQPRGVVFSPNGERIYVALAGANEVVELDWTTRKPLRRWPAPLEPRRLALSRDGRYLAAVSSRSAEVRCWDLRTGQERWQQQLTCGFNLLDVAFSPDDRELVVPHIHDRIRSIGQNNIQEGWAIDNRLSRLPLDQNPDTEYSQIALDERGLAVGDPSAVAFSADGAWLALAAAGTHELLIFQRKEIPWVDGDPGDLLNPLLAREDGKLRRLPLDGRPLAVQFVDNSDLAVVANYLLDSVQVVDVRAGKLLRTIRLGGPARPSLARQGEAIFYDARRSHHQWFSCHSCHTDGHTCSRTFDTLNDDSFGNLKLTPSLRAVTRTGPWTWHGWQTDLAKAVERSFTHTLYGPEPSAADLRAVVAYLATLEHPPAPRRKTEAIERGRLLFHGKARCVRCHQGEDYTSPKTYDVKLDPDQSAYDGWNPPSLRGVRDRGPYLHDGRVETLEELLKVPHAPEKLGGQSLTAEERRDLVEFLRSL